MNILDFPRSSTSYPERVLQFGEGQFLRGFIDWMLQVMNQQDLFHGRAVVIKPRPSRHPVPAWNEQDCRYTLITRGVKEGTIVNQHEIIDSISRYIGCYENYEEYLACAANPDLLLVVSNTTEAGIVYVPEDQPDDAPPSSFPAKLAVFLHARWQAFNGDPHRGLIIMPCELIEKNGTLLRSIILQYARQWQYETDCIHWIEEHCIFLNTLVDRIVSGYPAGEEEALARELGYRDALMCVVEPYHLLAIEGPDLSERLPFQEAGLNVVWTRDLSSYRTRKVRILNGAHTMTALAAYLAGLDTVDAFMKDPQFLRYVQKGLRLEIIPTISMPVQELYAYADSVLERFSNPFLQHRLLSIALNSVSKWKTRVLPSLLDQYAMHGQASSVLCFSLAALMAFYRCTKDDDHYYGQIPGSTTRYSLQDAPEVLSYFEKAFTLPLEEAVRSILSNTDFWGRDLTALPGLTQSVIRDLNAILHMGVRKALPLSHDTLTLHPKDHVAVALYDIPAGNCIEGGIVVRQDIPAGHKIALQNLAANEPVFKYGFPIGHTTKPVYAGEWVHSHNLATNLSGTSDYRYCPEHTQLPIYEPSTFEGYLRDDGQVGIRNEIWIINTVGCVNKTAELLAREAAARYGDRVDGIYAFPHPFGCSQLGEDHEHTRLILSRLVQHPNAAGVLVLSLGCENNTPEAFRKLLGEYDPQRVRFLTTQDVTDEIESGLSILDELTKYAAGFTRQPIPASRLIIGLKCGGSDGFSGITANPLIGSISDRLASQGGSAVLSEVPEMFGAETILMNHCHDQETFRKTVALINDFKEYFIRHGQVVYENPSPGNKKGGITTLEEKSLGCTQKGGHSDVQDVLRYGEHAARSGLSLLQGPGNDIVACTALTAAGCHMILFSTGRGTPLGAPVPTVKIATNSALASHKQHWIDYNAGCLLEHTTMETAEQVLWEKILKIASGEPTCNEKNGYREISIWKDGVTL